MTTTLFNADTSGSDFCFLPLVSIGERISNGRVCRFGGAGPASDNVGSVFVDLPEGALE